MKAILTREGDYYPSLRSRVGTARKAEANIFLLSDRASYVNADFMQVDGGQAESKMMHTPGRNWGGKKMDYSAS